MRDWVEKKALVKVRECTRGDITVGAKGVSGDVSVGGNKNGAGRVRGRGRGAG